MNELTYTERFNQLLDNFQELIEEKEIALACVKQVAITHVFELAEVMENDSDEYSSEYWEKIIELCDAELARIRAVQIEQNSNDVKMLDKKGHTHHLNFFVHPELAKVYTDKAKSLDIPVSRLYREALEMYSETRL